MSKVFFSPYRIFLQVALTAVVLAVPSSARSQLSLSNQAHLHTKVQLLADVASIRPGGGFTVGVLLRMETGWHTYWKNSGEAGLPTAVTWELPDGLTPGEILWPVPTKHVESGDILTFGYADETMLMIPVTASANVHGTLTLKATVNWLECERICVPGSSIVKLQLPVAPGIPVRKNEKIFDQYRSRLPGQAFSWKNVALRSWTEGHSAVVSVSPVPPHSLAVTENAAPDFYPEPSDSLVYGRTRIEQRGQDVIIRLPLSSGVKLAGPITLRGIVVCTVDQDVHQAGEMTVTLPAEFCQSLKAADTTGHAAGLLDQTFEPSSMAGSQPLVLYILFGIVGGLLLNIMPCVLPVIALKIFGLVRMAGDQPRQIRRLGWLFSLGILASFLALALLVIILKATGEEVGWGFQFQTPLFVILMSAVVFAFGLSLFGVFEIRLPSAAMGGVIAVVSEQTSAGRGYAASFAEGVFATVLATPCTAPFLGAALGFAFAQATWIILLIFTSIALGMALPYLVLTSRPGWMKFLPKPGEWMETAKQFMGFLMMATLLWLLYILGRQLGIEGVVWTLAFLLVVGFACWLIGRFATLTASRRTVALTWLVAALALVAGYWFFLDPVLEARTIVEGAVPGATGTEQRESAGIAWQPFSIAGLQQQLQGDKIVFVDFTADWCLTCKVNEKAVLSEQRIIDQFRSLDVVPIRADWTNGNPEITRLLERFGRSGVPLYVVFPPGKRNAPIVLPEVITSSIVLDALQKAAGKAPPA